jgi:hypothetical protein
VEEVFKLVGKGFEGLQAKKEQCSLRPATEETAHGSQGRPATNAERRGTSHGGGPLNEEKQDQMHATIEEEAVADEEDTDNGENIFV